MTIHDVHRRPLGSLRLSVTDRCNLRCTYCMPEDEYTWLPRASILTFEELERLTRIFSSLGARRVRLTGGEPLLRRHLDDLVARLAALPDVDDLALTTNGVLLERAVPALVAAGLDRVTVSLDTLDPARFTALSRSDRHADVVRGIEAARAAGLPVKLNTVVMRGVNDDELEAIVRRAAALGAEARFIEYMDVGGATDWREATVVPRAEILRRLESAFGPLRHVAPDHPAAPADRFALADGTTVGVIASTTEPFCRDCDRSRVTADGSWLLCLYADSGLDLREPLRAGASDTALADAIRERWSRRGDRGAEVRRELEHRAPLYQLEGLRADPRREMHTRGG